MKAFHITTRHKASKNGVPVFVDGSRLVDQAEGLNFCLASLGWDREELARRTGKSANTVRGWFAGRPIPAESMNVLRDAMEPRHD